MKNIIFYFTGTGNSLVIAQDIADKIGDTKLLSIASAIKEDDIDLSYERIGFVFPVYYSRVPAIVKRFIAKLIFNKSQYIFGVITFGGVYGKIFSELNHDVSVRGGALRSGFPVRMPGNYILNYGAFPKIIQRILFRRKKKKVNYISIAIKDKNILFKPKSDSASKLSAASVDKIIANFGENAQNFNVNGKCTGCTTCQKICPVGNIKMENNQPSWGKQCEQCMACIQWCPAQAIEYSDKTGKRKRYHNPEIKISDMISNSSMDH